MITIRDYQEIDSVEVGILIADTYREFNLSFVPPEEIGLFLGPFQYARSEAKEHRERIVAMIRSEMVFVAEDAREIVGVLRGRPYRLGSLFVHKDYHRRGIGCNLVEHFEQACQKQGSSVIRVAATLYAVPFYLTMGYKRSTGVRKSWSFDGHGMLIQPMRKVLQKPNY
jgi:GNAT superfamily N-acetyltransferase